MAVISRPVKQALVSLTALASLANFEANAASFAIQEQNVTNLGYAYAGVGLVKDASAGFYNPANLTDLDNDQFVFGAVYLQGSFKLRPSSATSTTGAALTNLSETKPSGSAIVPSLHMAKVFNDKIAASFNVIAPFGLKNEYDNDSVARFMATKSQLKTVNFSPSIAYKVNDKFSVGAGFDALYAKANINAVLNCGAGEGTQTNSASAWDYGFHLGLTYKVSKNLEIGLSYRSKYNITATGRSVTSDTSVMDGIKDVKSTVILPESIRYSIKSKYDEKWTAMADIEWVHWSRFRELGLYYGDGTSLVSSLYYKNTFRASFGTDYKYRDDLNLKFGFAYDQSPTHTDHRTARIPDSDRYWVSVGGKYKPNKNIEIDFGYSHLFFKRANISETAPVGGGGCPTSSQSLYGNYKSKADIIGVQFIWNFV